jgi:phosphatidylglycerophosphate synthase
MVTTAVVLANRPGAAAVVGGLPLAVRAALLLHGAGFDVALAAPGRPPWAAAVLAARGVALRWLDPAADPPATLGPGRTLVLAGDVLLDADAAASLRDAPAGPLRSPGGRPVGLVVPAGEMAAAALRLEPPTAAAGPAAAGTRIATGLAVALAEVGSPARLERRLLDHLASQAGDSFLAAVLDRRLSRPVTRLLLGTRLAPTHVTLASIAIGVAGALMLATGEYWSRLGGVLLLVASVVLDCVDGELARARLEASPAGARLDVLGDYVVNLAVFAGLAIGLVRSGLPRGGTWAALALVTGVGAAMTVVHALFIRPALRRGGDLHWTGDGASLRGRPGADVVEKLASRDYTYLLLLLAAIGHLDWFLYAAALGAWLFTAAVLGYAQAVRPGRRREAATP